MNHPSDELSKKVVVSQPPTRKSRSISRYFLGNKRASVDNPTQSTNDIYRCLISVGIFDSYDLWAHVTLFRDYTTCRRLMILTTKNELIIGKYNHRHVLYKIKQRVDLNRVWLYTHLNDSTASEITSLSYYDSTRSLIIGWPIAENFIIEFETKPIRDIWKEHIESTLRSWWQLNNSNIEHVRIVIDRNSELDQNNTTPSFLIRKVIGIRAEETVHDLIRKCIDAFHLRDPLVDNYVLFVTHDQSNGTLPTTNLNVYSSSQITNIPLIGHEHPYAIKMKHIKTTNHGLPNQRSFEGEEFLTHPTNQHSSTSSLNNVSTTNYHDFELRKRDMLTDNPSRKYRFFHKRKAKTQQTLTDGYHSSSTPYLSSPNQANTRYFFFGRPLDELISRYDHQLPPIIMQLFGILFSKGPDTIGIFRKVANTRSVKECIDKIERNVSIHDDELHPILAAGVFKHFLRLLPEPLFTSIQYDNFKKCLRLSTLPEKISFARKSIISTLPEANHLLLKGFICTLHQIAEHAHTNGMNPFNLGLCVSNSLFKTETTTIRSGKQEADVMSSVVEFLIQNCSTLFGSDILTCIPDKRIVIHEIQNRTHPNASSMESLDEVESSPHLPLVSRSHDSGLAASDPPFNDDSSEISEHFRRTKAPLPIPTPDWTTSIACGRGIVLTSIVIPNSNSTLTTFAVARRRSSKNTYKPSKRFLEREKLTSNTTDDSDNNSSMRSSATTIHNITIGKVKRSKSLSRHSSLGSAEHRQQPKQLTKESRRLTTADVKRTSSLKQFHRLSDTDTDDDTEQNSNKPVTINDRHATTTTSKTTVGNEYISTSRSTPEQQDLDLTTETLSIMNQRLSNSSMSLTSRSTSFTSIPVVKKPDITLNQTSPPILNHQQPIIGDSRSRYNSPLTLTTNKIHLISQMNTYAEQLNLSHNLAQKSRTDRGGRTFVHHSSSRLFTLGEAIQMKPIDESILSNDRRRSCHRQNALRYKMTEQERQSRVSEPVIINHNPTSISRYQSIERRVTPSAQPMKSFSFDCTTDTSFSSDHSFPVRDRTKYFEHSNQHKLSTGRENYV
ncbi:unnamed protein product [Adineta ricciae]|uniref:Rho-GAP domain-containing protein n=1 Tax=Adineta ricciae TaxID=249248 RepID=A0A815NA24_ADIRI|nr:unnamed protein product [Adineta ricciae]CAF1436451.1 unnamed protein product [Adineta ricciae]